MHIFENLELFISILNPFIAHFSSSYSIFLDLIKYLSQPLDNAKLTRQVYPYVHVCVCVCVCVLCICVPFRYEHLSPNHLLNRRTDLDQILRKLSLRLLITLLIIFLLCLSVFL